MLPTKFWLVHLAKRFQRRRFLEIDQSKNKNCLWQPCLLMNQDEMSSLYIEDLPYMLSIKFQFIPESGFREDFLGINQSDTRMACDGHVC